MSERHRVALGEAVVGEGDHLLPDPLGHIADQPPGGHAAEQALAQAAHPLAGPLGAHGLTQLVGLGGCEPGDVDGYLHELLLEQRDAQRLFERVLQQGVQVGDRLLPVAPPDVGMHRAALDGPGADECNLHHQVVEAAGAQPRQGGHLGA